MAMKSIHLTFLVRFLVVVMERMTRPGQIRGRVNWETLKWEMKAMMFKAKTVGVSKGEFPKTNSSLMMSSPVKASRMVLRSWKIYHLWRLKFFVVVVCFRGFLGISRPLC